MFIKCDHGVAQAHGKEKVIQQVIKCSSLFMSEHKTNSMLTVFLRVFTWQPSTLPALWWLWECLWWWQSLCCSFTIMTLKEARCQSGWVTDKEWHSVDTAKVSVCEWIWTDALSPSRFVWFCWTGVPGFSVWNNLEMSASGPDTSTAMPLSTTPAPAP